MSFSAATASPFGSDSRLNRRELLDIVRQRGVSYASRHVVAVVLPSPPDGSRRAAFLISRRFSLLAVKRNRARRLLRESWRMLYPSLAPVWVLLIPRRPIQQAKQQAVYEELVRSLTRGGVLTASAAELRNEHG